MKKENELLLINEIKNIERELYEKQSKLSSSKFIDENNNYGLDSAAWKKEFLDIIKNMRKISSGGNSVEEVRRERR